ncbi:plasmid SOS inhibition protein A [Escherichia coli]|nr:plasmid SOS inhibition protein A [Escherichia coli]
MSARSRALIPLSAEQQAAMQAVAVTEQRRRQGRTLSAWPYATAFFRCLNGSRRISLTDLRFLPCADEGGISWQPSPVAGCRG